MADVFISYAREDRPRAEQIAGALSAMGLECFWDTEIPPGQTWADYIENKLSQCKAVIVLWSAHSTKSQWVREEARMGRDKGRLIPVMLDASAPPFGFGEVQAADLSAWRGEPNHPGWSALSRAAYTAVRGADAPPQAPPTPPAARSASSPPAAAQFAYAGAAQSGVVVAESLPPWGYVQKCIRLSVDGSGRARRSEYGWFILAWLVLAVVAIMIDASLFGFNPYTNAPNGYLVSWLLLALAPAGVSVASRRLHDFGQNGWLAALTVVPYVGWVATLALIFIPGQAGSNKYGPSPKPA